MTIEQRVEKLERRNNLMVGTLIVFLAAFLLAAQKSNVPDEVRAREFSLVDDSGRVRGVWGITEDGDPRLDFFGDEGKTALAIGGGTRGGALALADAGGNARIGMVLLDGHPTIVMSDGKDTPQVAISVLEDGPRVTLADKDGTERVELNARITPGLSISDENGKIRIALGLISKTPVILLKDHRQKTRVSLGVDELHSGFDLFDEKGKKGMSLAVSQEGSGLVLPDKGGNTRATLVFTEKEGPTILLKGEKKNRFFVAP